ncbi:glycosyltransferase family 4 protein [Methanosarcina mazei]|uniref:Transposase n=1 Tax=Methanosarcina mazei TaxID=2209 RepID=A0A0F8DUS3_METMZ|nr:glycosyltransferase family 4 protein [Methanosarcina mazei]KKG06403.1 transposase [Methanosarcina mazei]KKG82088.1 transposase [Methanosarcina mazei]KKG92414.1 transposase [Methanosarcina mazei]KKH90877.1 transposase [Methanosarcina mazei]
MKILHLTKKYHPMIGGDAYAVYNLKKYQMETGCAVYVLTSNCDEITQNEKVFKYGLKDTSANLDKITPQRLISLFLLFFESFRMLGELKPDIIHSHSADLGFFISFAAKFYNIPVVNTCHGISFDDKRYFFLKRQAEKFFIKHSGFKKVIAVDKNGLEILKKAEIKNGIYIPNGVDIHRFENITREKNCGKIRFLFVGRLEKQKGLEYLLKATEYLRSKNDFEIIIAGNGREAKKLKESAKEYGIQDIVKFTGKLSEQELFEHYLKCDIFVLPSLWEGLPLTLLEAASAELPIIATKVGGIPSVFSHGKNAILVKSGESMELAGEMRRLMEDKKLREVLGSNARNLVEEYSWENSVKKLDSVYSLRVS